MEYTVNTEKNWKTTINVKVTADDINEQYNKAVSKIQKDVKLDGFRKGKVPSQLIKRYYKDQIQSEATQLSIESAWDKIFEENDFNLLDEPKIQNLKENQDGGVLFDIFFEIRPNIQVVGYENMPVEKIVFQVTPRDVEESIDYMRQKNAMLYTVDEPAKEGDYIVADFQQIDKSGVPVVGQKIENQQILLQKENNELTPQLVGVKAGEERKVSLIVKTQKSAIVEQPNLPDEQENFYQVKVKEVKERRLPELDDEFAKDVGPYDTFAELQSRVEQNLKHEAEHQSQHNFETALANELIKRMDFEIPETMLNRYLDNIIKDIKKRNKNSEAKIDEEQYREIYKVGAIRDLKWHIISEKLLEQENISVSDEDIEEKLNHIKEHENNGAESVEKIRKNAKEMSYLKEGVLFDKLYRFLEQKANVTQVTKTLQQYLDEEKAARTSLVE